MSIFLCIYVGMTQNLFALNPLQSMAHNGHFKKISRGYTEYNAVYSP